MNMAKPIRNPDTATHDVGDEALVYSIESGPLHILNPTAQFIWELCDGEHTVADIEQAMKINFFISQEHDVTEDIQRTLQLFADKKLLHCQAI